MDKPVFVKDADSIIFQQADIHDAFGKREAIPRRRYLNEAVHCLDSIVKIGLTLVLFAEYQAKISSQRQGFISIFYTGGFSKALIAVTGKIVLQKPVGLIIGFNTMQS